MVQNSSSPAFSSGHGFFYKDDHTGMDCAGTLSWIRSACRSWCALTWKLGLANGGVWILWDGVWAGDLCGRTGEPIPLVAGEGKIKDRRFPPLVGDRQVASCFALTEG